MLDLLIAMAVLQAPTPLPWRSVQRLEDREIFVAPASLLRRGDTFEIRVRTVLAAANRDGTKSMIVRNRFNCARQSVTTLNVQYFNARGLIQENRPPWGFAAQNRTVGADSPDAAILRLYCTPGAPG